MNHIIRLSAIALLVIIAGCNRDSYPDNGDAPRPGPIPSDANRQEVVAERGTMVMPFDLERTTHVFEKTESGGVQRVVSDDGDADQVRLIREHLAEEADKFSRGDFHDPAMIHGEDMAGLHALVMGHDRLDIKYVDIESGGRITYVTEDAELVKAIHAWFDQQVSDHGRHAEHGGHDGHGTGNH